MGFSCEIFQGKDNLAGGEPEFISYKLFGLGPSHPDDTEAPYSLSDFRSAVSGAEYADRLKEAAQDCFSQLQMMAKANLDALENRHCDSCTCPTKTPKGWSLAAISRLLSIDATSITKISGGY